MSLWGNKDLVYSAGTIAVNLGTKTVTGAVGVVTFTTSGISTSDVITVGVGATYGYAVITGFTSTTISIASTEGFVSGLTTVPSGTFYFISEEPLYTVVDSVYRAPESKTVGYSTSPVFTTVVGVSTVEVVLQILQLEMLANMLLLTLVGLELRLILIVTETSELKPKH